MLSQPSLPLEKPGDFPALHIENVQKDGSRLSQLELHLGLGAERIGSGAQTCSRDLQAKGGRCNRSLIPKQGNRVLATIERRDVHDAVAVPISACCDKGRGPGWNVHLRAERSTLIHVD